MSLGPSNPNPRRTSWGSGSEDPSRAWRGSGDSVQTPIGHAELSDEDEDEDGEGWEEIEEEEADEEGEMSRCVSFSLCSLSMSSSLSPTFAFFLFPVSRTDEPSPADIAHSSLTAKDRATLFPVGSRRRPAPLR